MILGPAPQFGRSSYFKGKPNYVAFGKYANQGATTITYDPAFRVSVDARRWRKALLQGDIRDALSTDGPLGECFVPVKIITFKGWTILAGALRKGAPFQERAAIYMGRGGRRYDRVTLPSDLLNPTGSGIVDIAANDDYVGAIGRNGVLYYWTGAGNWQSRTDLPMGDSPTTARQTGAIAATAAGFIIAGAYGNSNGTAGATRLISGASPIAAFTARTLPSVGQLLIAAKGNVMLAASGSSPPPGDQRVITSGLTDLVNWTAAGLVINGQFDFFVHNGVKWAGMGGYNRLLYTSTAGSGGWTAVSDQTKTPWGVVAIERPLVNSAITTGGKFITHWGYYSGNDAGGVSLSDDAETWERIDGVSAGLAPRPYLLGSLAA